MKALNKFISAIALSMLFAGAVQAQAPANDDCAGAITVTCGQTVTGSTLNANIDAAPACVTTVTQGYGVWYRFVGTGQTVTLSTCNATTNYDSQIAVFSGSCTALACVTANDNDAACGRKSTVTFNSTTGTTYYIWVTGVVGSRGNFALSVACSGGTGPANDACANAITVACGGSVSGSTTGATADAVGTCTTSLGTAPGVWYKVTGNGGTVTASLCGSGYDTKIGVFSGTCGALTCVAGNDDFCSLQSQVSFNSTNGTTYYILVTGFSTASGNFTLNVTCTAPPSPTDNDFCAGATPIACGGSATGTTTTATTDAVGTCTTTLNTAPGRWYSFVGTGLSVTVSTCNPGTDYDTKLGVFSGSCGALTCIGGNDDTTAPECVLPATGFNRKSRVTFTSVLGTTYYILVTGFSTNVGTYELSVTCATTLAEDNDITDPELAILSQVGKQGVGQFVPNPAQFDNTVVKVYTPSETQAQVVLHDNMGRLMLNRQVELFEGLNPIELSVSDLPIGTYFATITMNGEVFRRKLVIAH